MTAAQAILLRAAKDAREYFDRRVTGRAGRGMYEVLTIGRDLTDAIAAVESEIQEARETACAAQFVDRR